MASTSASTSSTNQAELVARAAKDAFDAAQLLPDGATERVNALRLVKAALNAAKEDILRANALDMEVRPRTYVRALPVSDCSCRLFQAASAQVAEGKMSSSLLKRLDLLSSPTKFDDMLQGVEDVAKLPDPDGITTYASKLDEGLELHRITCKSYLFHWIISVSALLNYYYLSSSSHRSNRRSPRHIRSPPRSDCQHHLSSHKIRQCCDS